MSTPSDNERYVDLTRDNLNAALARASQAEQALAQARAGHDVTISICHGLKERLAEARREYAEMDDRIDVQDCHLAEVREALAQAEEERDAWVVLHDLVKAERDEWRDLCERSNKANDKLRDDRDRLRTALERIQEMAERVEGATPEHRWIANYYVLPITRAALGSTTEPEEAEK